MTFVDVFCTCPRCGATLKTPFVPPCSNCGFEIDHLTGKHLSDFQKEKWDKHRELFCGATVSLGDGDYNASFNYAGDAKIDLLTKFAISYGHESTLPSPRGTYLNPVRVAFVPEIIGSGTSVGMIGNVPVSGFCLISPHSEMFGHSFPAITDWVTEIFGDVGGVCRFCGRATQFGLVVCDKCYTDSHVNDWTKLL